MLVFARAPEPGRVKRRLIPAVGERGAAQLHVRMTQRVVRTAVEADIGPVQVWGTMPLHHPFFEALRHEWGVELCCQPEGDLGARMHEAFDVNLKQHPWAILVGSDCPFWDAADFVEVARQLATSCDAVIGPARDGGYVLLGLRQTTPLLFHDMAWGSSEILDETRRRFRHLGWTCHELPEHSDIDRPEDLRQLGREWFSLSFRA
jgi:rSAM/selenodomain-associated transferase 1